MTSFWNKLTHLIKGVANDTTQKQRVQVPAKDAAMAKIAAGMAAMTREEEVDCEAVYALMDEYAELVQIGKDVKSLMPKVDHHLSMCSGCCEEYEILRSIIEAHDSETESS